MKAGFEMSYLDYKFLHFLAILALFLSIGAFVGEGLKLRIRTVAFAGHGLALIFILVSGFGMLAKIGIKGNIPNFVWYKLAIWFALGFVPPILRKRSFPLALFSFSLGLGTLACLFAVYKVG